MPDAARKRSVRILNITMHAGAAANNGGLPADAQQRVALCRRAAVLNPLSRAAACFRARAFLHWKRNTLGGMDSRLFLAQALFNQVNPE